DLDYFLKYWLHVVAEGMNVDTGSLFPCVGPLPAGVMYPHVVAARRMMRRYCARLDIDPTFVPVLSVYNWVEHTLNRRARDRILDVAPLPTGETLARIQSLAAYSEQLGDDPFAVLGPPSGRKRIAIAAPFSLRTPPAHGGARVIGDMAAALATRHDV